MSTSITASAVPLQQDNPAHPRLVSSQPAQGQPTTVLLQHAADDDDLLQVGASIGDLDFDKMWA